MNLLELPVDLFMKQITYLPYEDVISLCQSSKQIKDYCMNNKYNVKWKSLINNTFYNISKYEEIIKNIRWDLDYDENTYNYIVYTELGIRLLDPITQLMIYYRQKDKSFNNNKRFNNFQRFLAMFLLNNKILMKKYYILNDDDYKDFYCLTFYNKYDQDKLNKMLNIMSGEGNLLGVKYLIKLGADIHNNNDWPLRTASGEGHLDIVKYLVEIGADIHAFDEDALFSGVMSNHLDVVKYLVEKGADIHAVGDWAVRHANLWKHQAIVDYLLEKGAKLNR